ncbi:heat shock 70 kDa protein 12B-like [Argopecten irradians]|uniref:heat shock 70 kDa protein 12B-like n=1 Tax=Argopecten irradians TaxID=31199 RepID=UPI00371E206E
MSLYENKFLNRCFQLEDDQGAKMPAMTVFSSSIKYLKDHMMETCRNQVHNIEDSDILWVLTVPAIWSDASKQFMREAAVKAGIESCSLRIALEPEAASLYCKHLPMEKGQTGISSFSAGSKYLVLDAGGGTIDITVHQVQEDGSLKEIHKANGGDWGGTKVDIAYQTLLTRIIGDKGFGKFCRENKADMIELFRDFEIKKRTVNQMPDVGEKLTFKIPTAMNECCRAKNKGKDMKKMIKSNTNYKEHFSITGDKLRVAGSIAKDLFKDPVRHIIDHMKTIMRDTASIGTIAIILVGGFSESLVLQSEVRKAFPALRISVPPESGLAVLKGAVIFGHEPRIITSRICKYTYGMSSTRRFEEGVHDPSKLFTTSFGERLCRDIYDIHVCRGDSLDISKLNPAKTLYVCESNQTSILTQIFASTQEDPMYVTDPSCCKIGELHINMTDTSRGLHRGVNVQMRFGNTELEVEATNIFTGESVNATFDFLK